jgi:hypothetical protein
LPRSHRRARGAAPSDGDDLRCPRIFRLRHDVPDDRRPSDSLRPDDARTIGDRVREKYERAVFMAARAALRRRSARDDRSSLVAQLVEHRLRVPEDTERKALRAIADETGSSMSRVSQCWRAMEREVRQALLADPEFVWLLNAARVCEGGAECVIDGPIDAQLRDLSAEWFARKLEGASEAVRARVLLFLLEQVGGPLRRLVKLLHAGLDRQKADEATDLLSAGQ